jgi:alcohol dehydrogenase class IV
MTYQHLSGKWNYPNDIRAGNGEIKNLVQHCLELGIRRPLLVTDPGLANLPILRSAYNTCQEEGLDCQIFSDIKSNPTGENVENGVSAYKNNQHDGIIAFGGGSALDAAKAIALMVGQNRPIWDFEDIGDNWTRVITQQMAPVIAVPTTAGTGSEVGRASVITDAHAKVKRIIFHPDMLPVRVILDPELTTGLPAPITAATGMDALSHSLEALCSPFYHPMAEGIACEGIRLVNEYLPIAVKEGNNVEARMQMLVASTMGATAFQKGLGAMHALAHPLGALFDAHHGLLNAILMPYVLKTNRNAIEERITRLSRYLDLAHPGFDAFMERILGIRQEIGIPHTLREINIDESQQEKIGMMAAEDPSASGNPISLTAKQYSALFVKAVRGEL